MDSYIHGQWILNECAKTIKWGKDIVFSANEVVLGKLDIHMQKTEVGPLPHNIYKN